MHGSASTEQLWCLLDRNFEHRELDIKISGIMVSTFNTAFFIVIIIVSDHCSYRAVEWYYHYNNYKSRGNKK